MKKFIGIFIVILLLLNSCVSNDRFVYGPTITANELETIEIIGSVETLFETTISWNKNNILLERSYYELLKIAQRKYTGKIDIKNIVIEKQHSSKSLLFFIPMFFNTSVEMSYANIYARGEVVMYKTGAH